VRTDEAMKHPACADACNRASVSASTGPENRTRGQDHAGHRELAACVLGELALRIVVVGVDGGSWRG
jgi:hypothetical protein